MNAKGNDGCNALHHLCENSSCANLVDAIRNLIQCGIDVNVKVNDGSNALHYLCRYNSSSNLITAMEFLIGSRIDAKEKSNDGSNALHYLCRYNSSPNLTDAIKLLIENKIDVNAKDNEGSNAGHYLIQNYKSSNLRNAIQILIDEGIDTTEKDKSGRTIFDYLMEDKLKKKMEIEFDRNAFLGGGGYGSVFKGKLGNRQVAVKRVVFQHVNSKEEALMLQLDHLNIVKLLLCASDKDFRYYALELCEASLDKLFLKSDNPKRYNGAMPRRVDVFLQLALGLEHIHSQGFTHRDVKPQNILISKGHDNVDGITIKWADFGLSTTVNKRGTYTIRSTIKGTET
ncbi:calcium-dependent protein kinase 1-like [Daphnia magna]|uniref:calcium-dependent protein kinase 1-like n=1 Tax=Daphnia magna TaxID=35525 RepID=UPI001E1BBDD8|nr:calcium-dependent protein kinase 1-like [Daphnia magna]